MSDDDDKMTAVVDLISLISNNPLAAKYLEDILDQIEPVEMADGRIFYQAEDDETFAYVLIHAAFNYSGKDVYVNTREGEKCISAVLYGKYTA